MAILGAAMIVSLIATASIAIQRIQRRTVEDQKSALSAKSNSQVAIRLAVQSLTGDQWRTTAVNGYWDRDIAFGGGSYSIHGVDPVDGDFTDDIRDPIIITGVGKQDGAKQQTKVTIVPTIEPFDSILAGIWAGEGLSLDNSTIYSEQVLGSNLSITANGSAVAVPVESAGIVSGGTFQSTVSENVDPRDIPLPNDVLTHYGNLASEIDYSTLPTLSPRLIPDGGFESGTSTFHADDAQCQISRTTTQKRSGEASLLVSNRVSSSAAPVLDVTQWLVPGQILSVYGLMRRDSWGGSTKIELTYRAKGAAEVTETKPGLFAGPIWLPYLGFFTPTWDGPLEYAYIKIYADTPGDFYIDDLDLRLNTYSGRWLFRELIGPNTHQSDPNDLDGVYLIDCGNSNIFIKNCRIKGTLILLNPGAESRIAHGPIVWEPAIDNYPALLVSSDDDLREFAIKCNGSGLSEVLEDFNFNPASIPYRGESNTDKLDVYSPGITGIIYSNAALRITNELRLEGVVTTPGPVYADNATINIRTFHEMERMPPDHFRKETKFRILPNSVEPSLQMID